MPKPRMLKLKLKLKKKLAKPRFFRKKFCRFCKEKVGDFDYKDAGRLQKFISERGKIIATRISGNCAKHQRRITRAIKRARVMALLPFVTD